MKPPSVVALAALALLSFGAVPALAQSPPERSMGVPPAPAPITLDNGLRVAIEEDHRSPYVGVVIRIPTGKVDDPRGRTGLADLIGELLLRPSTRHVAGGDRGSLFRALGVPEPTPTLVTLADTTRISFTVPARALPLALWLEADRLGFFTDGLCADEIAAARSRIDASITAKQADPYGQVVPVAMSAAFGPASPYGHAFGRTTAEIGALETSEVRAQVERLYTPSNTVLAISGDLDPVAVRALITQTFGALHTRPRPAAAPVATSGLDGERRITMDAGVTQPMTTVVWPTARYLTDDDLTLDLVALALAVRLDRRLIRDAHRAERVSSWQQSFQGASAFVVQVRGVVGSAPDDLLRGIDQELDLLRGAPLPAAELAAIQDRKAGEALFEQTNPLGRAGSLADYLVHVGDTAHLAKVLATRRAVDGEAFRKVVVTQLPPGRRVVTFVRPAPSAPPAGKVVGGE